MLNSSNGSLFTLLQAALGSATAVRQLTAGECLFRAGETATALFGIAEGRLRLLRHTVDGGSLVVAAARVGDTLAEASLFSPSFHCDAIADVDSTVVAFPHREIRAAIADNPRLAEALVAALARQVQDLRARLELRNVKLASDRVLYALHLGLGEREPDLPLKDLASEIGLTPACLYRTLAKLEKSGRLDRDGGRLRPRVASRSARRPSQPNRSVA